MNVPLKAVQMLLEALVEEREERDRNMEALVASRRIQEEAEDRSAKSAARSADLCSALARVREDLETHKRELKATTDALIRERELLENERTFGRHLVAAIKAHREATAASSNLHRFADYSLWECVGPLPASKGTK